MYLAGPYTKNLSRHKISTSKVNSFMYLSCNWISLYNLSGWSRFGVCWGTLHKEFKGR